MTVASNLESILDEYLNIPIALKLNQTNKLNTIKPKIDKLLNSTQNNTLILHTTTQIIGFKINDYILNILKIKKLMTRVTKPEMKLIIEFYKIYEYILYQLKNNYEMKNPSLKKFNIKEILNVKDDNWIGQMIKNDNKIKLISEKLSFNKLIKEYKKIFTNIVKSSLKSFQVAAPLIKAIRELESPSPCVQTKSFSSEEKEFNKNLALDLMKMIEFDPKTVFPIQLKADILGKDLVF